MGLPPPRLSLRVPPQIRLPSSISDPVLHQPLLHAGVGPLSPLTSEPVPIPAPRPPAVLPPMDPEDAAAAFWGEAEPEAEAGPPDGDAPAWAADGAEPADAPADDADDAAGDGVGDAAEDEAPLDPAPEPEGEYPAAKQG